MNNLSMLGGNGGGVQNFGGGSGQKLSWSGGVNQEFPMSPPLINKVGVNKSGSELATQLNSHFYNNLKRTVCKSVDKYALLRT